MKITFPSLLLLVLLTLKLTHQITWSWCLVTLPLTAGVGLLAVLIVLALIAAAIAERRS